MYMIAAAVSTQSRQASPAQQLFKTAASVTFALGVLVHVGRMVMGAEQFVRLVFTPPVDIAFGILMLVAAVPGVLLWKHYSGGRAGRVAYAFAMLILVVSVPLHLRTALTWSTEYLLIFPFWYSAMEVPMFAGLSYMVTQLNFDGRPARSPVTHMEIPEVTMDGEV